MKIFVSIPWFHPAYKAGGPIQSIANMVRQMCNYANGQICKYQFNIFCSNKDLDGSLLQGVAFDEWVNYNAHTKIWYSSSNNILPVLQREIKNESSIIT